LANDKEAEGATSLFRPCFLIIILASLIFWLIWIFFDSQMLAVLVTITTLAAIIPAYCLTEKAKSGRTRFQTISSRAAILSENYEKVSTGKSKLGVRYVFPIQCPECREHLDPGSVDWIDGTSAICSKCRTIVRASIEET
jgi:hypothetical protein